MTYEDLFQTLQRALSSEDPVAIRAAVAGLRPADLADCIEDLDGDGPRLALLMALAPALRSTTFGYLSLPVQAQLARRMSVAGLAALFQRMPTDEQADLFQVLEAPRQRSLYRLLTREEREDLRNLVRHEDGTAGAIMTADYAAIQSGSTVADALARLRLTAPDRETIYQTFVVDAGHHLIGTLSLRELILAPPEAVVDDLMQKDVVRARAQQSDEDVARIISRYDLLAVPIVDDDGRLVGIVTYDDAMDVVEAETTEDIHKGATVGKLDASFRDVSPWSLYRSRIHWLVALVFVNIFTGAGIAMFEDMIAAHVALLFFMPLLVASAGNAGSQSATLMVRGLATGDVTGRDWARLFARELLVAAGLGLTMAAAVAAVGVVRAGPDIAVVVALTMVVVVMTGSLMGMLLPYLLQRLKFDPATASTPLISTMADVSGVLIYFSLATWWLGGGG